MSVPIDSLDSLQKPAGTMKILAYLHNKEKATITNLINDADLNQKTTYSALEKLQDCELVCMEKSTGFPVYKYYMLTEKGKKVAEKVGALAYVLSGEL